MTDPKLIGLLKKLSADELKEFERFIASPFFSRGRDLNPLFKVLKSFYPEFNDKNLNDRHIFTLLYPGKNFDETKSHNLLKTLFSDMYKMCKNFLTQLEFMHDGKRNDYYLINQLRKRKLYKELDKNLIRIDESADFLNKGSMEYFIENYFFNCVKRDYSLDKDDFSNTYESTLKISEIISVMALIKCLRNPDENTLAGAFNLKTRYNLTDTLLRNINLEDLLEEMKNGNDNYYPYVLTYYFVYKLNTDKNDESYFALKDHVNEYSNLWGKDELYILRSILLTYCAVAVSGKNRKVFLREQFELYDGNLKLGIYKRNDEEKFHVVLFRNMVISSGNVGETEWLDNFITKYSPELPDEHRENLINFSYGILCLTKKEYERSLEFFSKIKLSLFAFKIDARIFQLILYYELNYTDQAYSLIDSTGHFLNDTSHASEIVANSTKNFVKYYRELLNIKNSNKKDRSDLDYLRKQIVEEKILASRDWLIAKTT